MVSYASASPHPQAMDHAGLHRASLVSNFRRLVGDTVWGSDDLTVLCCHVKPSHLRPTPMAGLEQASSLDTCPLGTLQTHLHALWSTLNDIRLAPGMCWRALQ